MVGHLGHQGAYFGISCDFSSPRLGFWPHSIADSLGSIQSRELTLRTLFSPHIWFYCIKLQIFFSQVAKLTSWTLLAHLHFTVSYHGGTITWRGDRMWSPTLIIFLAFTFVKLSKGTWGSAPNEDPLVVRKLYSSQEEKNTTSVCQQIDIFYGVQVTAFHAGTDCITGRGLLKITNILYDMKYINMSVF